MIMKEKSSINLVLSFDIFQAWLRRLSWLRAMAHWPENGGKSRNDAQVSPLGIHCQGHPHQ